MEMRGLSVRASARVRKDHEPALFVLLGSGGNFVVCNIIKREKHIKREKKHIKTVENTLEYWGNFNSVCRPKCSTTAVVMVETPSTLC
jgi:hypothetical protein